MSERPSQPHGRGDRDSNNPHAQRRPDEPPRDPQEGYNQRGGYNETAGPGDNRSSLYGNAVVSSPRPL